MVKLTSLKIRTTPRENIIGGQIIIRHPLLVRNMYQTCGKKSAQYLVDYPVKLHWMSSFVR